MEWGAFEMKRLSGNLPDALIAIAEGAKVLARARRHVAEQFEFQSTSRSCRGKGRKKWWNNNKIQEGDGPNDI